MAEFHIPRAAGGGAWTCTCGAVGATSDECARHVEAQRRSAGLVPNPDVDPAEEDWWDQDRQVPR